jgi:3'-phosphoadenosine 5'-phosphosulfate sulfotransferase (PAPS reductase)/FAD synthetase
MNSVSVRYKLSPIQHWDTIDLKSEIRNLKIGPLYDPGLRQSNLKFRISDLRCRIRPISKSPLLMSAGFVKYIDAGDGHVARRQ